MQAFSCPVCEAGLFFDNSLCLTCGTPVGYDRGSRRLVAVSVTRPICANLDRCACNWIAEASSPIGLCFNCSLTRTRPVDSDLTAMGQYAVAESAKRRLVFGLDELGLPLKVSDGYLGLAFDLLSSRQLGVVTGYHNGVITLDLAESDDVHREQLRASMGEPYRTVIGHLRHEIGHYYAELLVLTAGRRSEFRALFGDESQPYDVALARHYREGPAPQWQLSHVSAYATMHPLEDFAEVFAHYLHISDTLQTAYAFGLLRDPVDLRTVPIAETLATVWLPLTRALNQINRSLGQDDLYPFVLAEPVVAKLEFVGVLVGSVSSS